MKEFKIITLDVENIKSKNFEDTKEYLYDKIMNGYMFLTEDEPFFADTFYREGTLFEEDFEIVVGTKKYIGVGKRHESIIKSFNTFLVPDYTVMEIAYRNGEFMFMQVPNEDYEEICNEKIDEILTII